MCNKKVMKILVVIIGIFFGTVLYLQTQGVVEINWDKIQSVLESTLLTISNALSIAEQIPIITGNLRITLTGGLSAGLLLGFSKG